MPLQPECEGVPGVIRLVASDIDGTLTERRGSLLLSIDAVLALRKLEASGIPVTLVSGNSVPITAGLARYVGASGPSVGENGCVIYYRERIYHVCEGRPSRRLVEYALSLGLRESWQNQFRFHDLAFLGRSREEMARLLPLIKRAAEEENMRVLWSGYAIHVQPKDGGKLKGILKAAELLGVSRHELAVIGDGENDLDMFIEEAFKACPGDADETLKKVADYVASKPGGAGFAEIAEEILKRTG